MKMIQSSLPLLAGAFGSLLSLSVIVSQAAEDEPPATRAPGISIAAIKRTQPVDFQNEILPILKSNCLACHNQTKAKAELILESPQSILKGGDSGPAVVPGQGSESLLLRAASHQSETVMPPRDNKVNASDLTSEQLGLIKLWIDQGAKGEVRASPQIVWKTLPDVLQPILALATTDDGQFAACGRGNQIDVYHLPSKQLAVRLTDPELVRSGLYTKPGVAHRDLVNSLAFNSDGTLLASGDYRQVKLWRRPRDVQALVLKEIGGQTLQTLAVSSDGHWLAIVRNEREIKLISLPEAKEGKVLSGHGNRIHGLAFSPDGTKLVSGSEDKSIRVWDVRQGDLIAQVTAPTAVRAVTWGVGGSRIVTGGADPVIRLWKLPEAVGGELSAAGEIRGHEAGVTSLQAFGSDGKELLSGSADGSIRHWNMETGKPVREMKHGAPVSAVAVRGDGKRFASASSNSMVKLWNAETGQAVADLKGDRYASELAAKMEREASFASSEISYRKSAIASTEKEQKAQADRKKKATEASESAEKAYAEKQKLLATAAEAKAAAEKALADFNAEHKRITEEYRAAEFAAQKFATNAKTALATALERKGSGDPAADSKTAAEAKAAVEKAIDEAAAKALAQGQLKPRFDQFTKEAPETKKKAEEKVTATAKAHTEADKEFKKADLAKSTAETELQLSTKAETQALDAVTAAKSALQAAEDFQKKTEQELKTAKQAASDSEKPIRALAFSPDDQILATAGDDPSVRTWSAESGAPIETLKGHTAPIAGIAFARNGVLVSGSTAPSVVIWELNPEWKLERVIGTDDSTSPLADRVNSLQFSPDGQRLATGSGEPTRGGEIKIWEVATGKLLQEFTNVHSDAVFSLDFTADGKYLASGAADKFVRVLELSSGKVVKSFEGHTHHVLGVSWKRDGRTIISAGADNVIKVWDFLTGERKKNIDGFNKEVTGVRFIGITDQAVACSGDNQVRIVKENGDKVRSFEGVAEFMHSVTVTPDGKIVVAGGQDSVLRVWNGLDGKAIATFDPPAKTKDLAEARTPP